MSNTNKTCTEYAFPIPDTYHPSGQVEYGQPGMTLRDYFAAKAMHASLHQIALQSTINARCGCSPDETMELVARASYAAADAMMKARMTQP